MSPAPRRPRLRSCLLALLLLLLAPAVLDAGRRPVSSEPPETALANALGPSHESALVVRAVKGFGTPGALRDGGPNQIPAGPALLLLGTLALLLGVRPTVRPGPRHLFSGSLRSPSVPAPSGPRAPPVPRLT